MVSCFEPHIDRDLPVRLGYDGLWSPISVQVGSPVQSLKLLPSTSGQEVLVVGREGCDGTFTCRTLRGGLFETNGSTSFRSVGDYDLGLSPQLGLDSAAYYGLDTVAAAGSVSEVDQLVAIVNSTKYWTGSLGLGMDNTTIGTRKASSFLSSLVQSQQIPGHSYGYTAGASYRLKQVPASLVLGGYDSNRFVPNDATFSLSPGGSPVVAINSITLDGLDNPTLMDGAGHRLFEIDSTTPFLWLPETVADNFGNALGLGYNDTLGVFTYPNISHYSSIMSSKLSVTFELADVLGDETKVTLRLDGDAFTSQNLSFGFPGLGGTDGDDPVPYFPIRKAANATQYTLGRCFLQETYLTVDYDRNNFSVSQAKFLLDSAVNLQIVDIVAPDTNQDGVKTTSMQNSSGGLSTGLKVGIAVGVIAIIACVTTLIFIIYFLRWRRAEQKVASSQSSTQSDPPLRKGLAQSFLGANRKGAPVSELPAREADPDSRSTDNFSHGSTAKAAEVDGVNEIKELPAPVATVVELPGSPVPERERRSSIAKTSLCTSYGEQPAPTYLSNIISASPPSESVSIPSSSIVEFLDLSSSTGPSPESTNSGTMSSLPSETNSRSVLRQPSTRNERAVYTLDDTQTLELKPTDLRPPGLVTPENSQAGSHQRFSWENSV